MTRRYADAVDVRRQDDRPAQFLWRGRLYVVRAVLEHWTEVGHWWRAARADDVEREYWRVEAGRGRLAGTGVFDLCFDWAGGGWTVTRTHD